MHSATRLVLLAAWLIAILQCLGCETENRTAPQRGGADSTVDDPPVADDDDDGGFVIVGNNLPPAPQPDLSGAHQVFHVAALEVQLPLERRSDPTMKAVDFMWIPQEVSVQVGDTVTWVRQEGLHGVTFTNWPQAEQVLEVEGGLEIKPQPQWGTDARGTDAEQSETVLLRARVGNLPAGVSELPFICTKHGFGMSGTLALAVGDGDGEATADVPILAYVPIVTDAEAGLADEITQLTRTLDEEVERAVSERIDQAEQDDPTLTDDQDQRVALEMQFRPEERERLETPVEDRIEELRGLLRERFRDRPEPLVLRVAAPAEGEAPVAVGVKLINLLPSEMEVEDRGGTDGTVWSPVTSLHASLVRYDVQQSHGSGAGMNLHSMCVRGDTRHYLWSVDRELGVCCLGDLADPEHQTAGLFGALIVEPSGSIIENATPDQTDDVPPGWQAIVRPDDSSAFREFVIFVHDDFVGSRDIGGFAINYYAAADSAGDEPRTPVMAVHAGDRVVVRQVHAAGVGDLNNHSFFIGGRRWPFDIDDDRSNHVAAIAEAPWSAFNIQFDADADVVETRSYLYGSHVGNQITKGEWGLLQVLIQSDPRILPLP